MDLEQNKQTIREFIARINAGNTTEGLALFAPDAIWWAPGDRKGGVPHTREEMRGFIPAFYGAFKVRPTMTIVELTAEENRVAARLSISDGVTFGGLHYGNDVHLLARFEAGRIVEVREYFNTLLAAPVIAEIKARAQPA